MTTEVKEQMKQFQLFAPPVSKSYTENPDGTLTLEGIASTTNKDLQGDIILPSAIYSMKQQLLTTTKNLHGDHRYGLDGIYGAIKEVLDSDDNSLKIKATIRKSKAAEIKEMLDIGVNLGLSIGGKITEYSTLKEGWEIEDLKLMEISLTGMPANYDTFGTVKESKNQVDTVGAKCLAGACHVIRKDLNSSNDDDDDGDDMTEENIQNEDKEIFTKDDAVELFNELMSTKQEEIARETVNLVSKAKQDQTAECMRKHRKLVREGELIVTDQEKAKLGTSYFGYHRCDDFEKEYKAIMNEKRRIGL